MKTIPIAKPFLGKEELEAVKRVMKSGILAHGPEVEAFEKEFAEYIGVKYAVAVANGTAALDLALKAIGVKEGDEVITTPFTFIATANAILFQRAKPVFADIDPKTYNLDQNEVLEKITNKTKAIIVVHLYGQPADMKAFKEIAEDHKLYLIEDSAQAHGAEFMGQKTGSFGDVAIFSFYPTKNMTTGEGGMVTTNNKEIADRVKLLRNHGQSEKYLHVELGWNLRMTSIAAAIGRAQLRKLDKFNEIRRRNAELLTRRLSRIRGITPPYVDPRVKHVFHQYVVRIEDDFPLSRDELQKLLREKGIGTAIHYPRPIFQQPLYKRLGYKQDICPNAIDASKRVLSLPVHPLVEPSDIEYIINSIQEIISLA
ncbi:MAG: DegT/DnrJ/EryC1/StrS family aminotransferase [Staphylothermus sp.]|nr:DegT/DnrJ/EryC1/StrS family aminotransferase [Staphylothermus sp.]